MAVQNIQPGVNTLGQLEIRLQAAGGSHESAVELVRRLETSPHFQQARILAESRQGPTGVNRNFGQDAGQNSAWLFGISAEYIPSFSRPAQSSDKPEASQAETKEKAGDSSTAVTPTPQASETKTPKSKSPGLKAPGLNANDKSANPSPAMAPAKPAEAGNARR